MNQPTVSHRSRQGFTLIELLVVIAIIAVLAAVGFGAAPMVINKAKRTTAFNDCAGLVQAIQLFYDDYNYLPEVEAGETPPGVKTDSILMNQLVGIDEETNPRGNRYFQGKDAKGTSMDRAYDGIFYQQDENAELFDPWKKVTGNARNNRHYFVMMDINFDDEIPDPFEPNQRPLRGRLAIAWCTGKDGDYATGTETAPSNRDNVYSWK